MLPVSTNIPCCASICAIVRDPFSKVIAHTRQRYSNRICAFLPEFFDAAIRFARLQTVDWRYPAQDDSLLLEELPRRYLVAKEGNDFLLLHRKPVQPAEELVREKLPMRRVSFGQEIELPETVNCAIELRAIFKPSIYGAARAFLVKPAEVSLVLTDGKHGPHTGRLIPEMGGGSFSRPATVRISQGFC